VWEQANGAIQTNTFSPPVKTNQSKIIRELLNTEAKEMRLFTRLSCRAVVFHVK